MILLVSENFEDYSVENDQAFKDFKKSQLFYWIEGSLVTYLRVLVIGVIRDEYYHFESEYNDLQLLIKKRLKDVRISNSYDIDNLFNMKGLNELMI